MAFIPRLIKQYYFYRLLRDRTFIRRKIGYGQPVAQTSDQHYVNHQHQHNRLPVTFFQSDPSVRRQPVLINQYLRVLTITGGSLSPSSTNISCYAILLLRSNLASVKKYLGVFGSSTTPANIIVLQGPFSYVILLVRSSFPFVAHHPHQVHYQHLASRDGSTKCSQHHSCGYVFAVGEKTVYRTKFPPSASPHWSPAGENISAAVVQPEEETQCHAHPHQQETTEEEGEGLRSGPEPFLIQCGMELERMTLQTI